MKASRLARMLGMDRNPLRRGTDRVESWLTLVVTLALLVGGPLVVWQAGAAAYRGAAAAAARDQQSQHRYQITAVLRDDATRVGPADHRPRPRNSGLRMGQTAQLETFFRAVIASRATLHGVCPRRPGAARGRTSQGA